MSRVPIAGPIAGVMLAVSIALGCGGMSAPSVTPAPRPRHAQASLEPDAHPELDEPEVDESPEDAPAREEDELSALRRAVGEIAPALVERAAQTDGEYSTFEMRREGDLVVVRFDESGNGIYGAWDVDVHVLSSAGPALELSMSDMDGAYVSRVLVRPDPRSSAQLDALRAAVRTDGRLLESAQGSDAARAQLFLSVRTPPPSTRAGVATIVGPLYLPGRVVRGAPLGSRCEPGTHGVGFGDPVLPALYLRSSVLGVRGLAVPGWLDGEAPEEEGGGSEAAPRGGELVRVAAVSGCAHIATHAGVELRSYEMLGRNRGALVALFDPGAGTHRWILETRNAVLGSDVRWLGARRGVIFGTYRANHPGEIYSGHGGIVAVRVRDGAVFRVDVDAAFADDMRLGVQSEEGERMCRDQRESGEQLAPEEVERCRALLDPVELGEHALRVRRVDGSIIEAPLGPLIARIGRLR